MESATHPHVGWKRAGPRSIPLPCTRVCDSCVTDHRIVKKHRAAGRARHEARRSCRSFLVKLARERGRHKNGPAPRSAGLRERSRSIALSPANISTTRRRLLLARSRHRGNKRSGDRAPSYTRRRVTKPSGEAGGLKVDLEKNAGRSRRGLNNQ